MSQIICEQDDESDVEDGDGDDEDDEDAESGDDEGAQLIPAWYAKHCRNLCFCANSLELAVDLPAHIGLGYRIIRPGCENGLDHET